jgi:hypothetical protein
MMLRILMNQKVISLKIIQLLSLLKSFQLKSSLLTKSHLQKNLLKLNLQLKKQSFESLTHVVNLLPLLLKKFHLISQPNFR